MTGRGDGTVDFPGINEIRSPDLARLDRDLREIVIEERSSFAAELRAELATEQARLLSGTLPYSGWARPARLAAAVVGLLAAGALLVPTARASLVRLLLPVPVRVDPVTEAESVTVDPFGDPTVPEVAQEDGMLPELETRDNAPAPLPEPDVTGVLDGPSPLTPTLPDVLNREQARRTVTEEYPVALQEAGIGGVVRLLLWVRTDGISETPKIRSSSGVPGLDLAAMRAARSIRFVPATRSGLPVGTWVEFSIRFVPDALGPQPDPGFQAFEIPSIN